MVFVWSRLTNGDPYFTLSQCAERRHHDLCLRAIVACCSHRIDHGAVGHLVTSVVLYIVIRSSSRSSGAVPAAPGSGGVRRGLARIGPWSITALLLTLVLLFASRRGDPEAAAHHRAAGVPILIQVFFNSTLAYVSTGRS